MDEYEIDAQTVIDVLRADLDKARWENVLLRAQMQQMRRAANNPPAESATVG